MSSRHGAPRGPSVMVIFGAGGDLSWRKLIPALYNLHASGRLPHSFAVFGIDKKQMRNKDWRQHLREGVDQFSSRGKADPATWDRFAANLEYVAADFESTDALRTLADRIAELEKTWDSAASRIFYLAIPPGLIETIASRLEAAGLAGDSQTTRGCRETVRP